MASLPVRHFPPCHFILARQERLRAKRGHPRLETYDAQIAQSQLVERHDALARISWYVISIAAPFRSLLPLRPFLSTFSTLPHSLPWRWCPVSVVESRRRQALDIGAFFLAPPNGTRVKVRDLYVRSRFRLRQLLSRICTVVTSHNRK